VPAREKFIALGRLAALPSECCQSIDFLEKIVAPESGCGRLIRVTLGHVEQNTR
jgi:hypothetical protein